MQQAAQKKPKKLQKNYSITLEGRSQPINFPIVLNGFIPGEDIVIGISPAAYYAKDPIYLNTQIRFFYDKIFSEYKTGRIIVVNGGSLGRHTLQLKLYRESVDQEVIAGTNTIEKNWERLFFGGEQAEAVEEMVRQGRLVYTTWDDWKGMPLLPVDVEQNDDKQDEEVDGLDEKILELRRISSSLESNQKIFEVLGGSSVLFQERHQQLKLNYQQEGSDVRKAINAWVDTFYGQYFSPSTMKGREEEIKSCILSYCLEEAVVVDMWSEHVAQMAYPFDLCSDLSKAAKLAWETVFVSFHHREAMKLLTLSLPPRSRVRVEDEAERIRAEAEKRILEIEEEAKKRIAEAEREAAETKKLLGTVVNEVKYNKKKLILARQETDDTFKERLEKEAFDGLDKVEQIASSTTSEESSEEEAAVNGTSPTKGALLSGILAQKKTPPLKAPKSVPQNHSSGSSSSESSPKSNSPESDLPATAVKVLSPKPEVDTDKSKISRKTVQATVEMGVFGQKNNQALKPAATTGPTHAQQTVLG